MPELKDYICEPSGYNLDDLFGMPYEKAMLGSCIPDEELDEAMGLVGPKGILLTGPLGSGKETLSVGLAGSLASCGYTYIRVQGSHLVRYPQLCEQLGETVLAVEQTAGTAGVYLYLDDVSPLAEQPEICELLLYALRNLLSEAKHLVVLATAAAKADVPTGLGKLLIECRVLPPTLVERRLLLEKAFEQRIFLENKCEFHTLAEISEGLTYGQLENVISHSLLLLKDKTLAWYGKNRESMLRAWKNGQVVLTEEMFRNVVEHLKQAETATAMVLSAEQKKLTQSEQEQPTEEPMKELDFSDIINMSANDL